MKYLLYLSLLISFAANACSDKVPNAKPYAKLISSMEENDARPYEIIVPKKNDNLFLTTLRIDIHDLIGSRVEFEEYHKNIEYYVAYISINENQIEKLKVRLKYSTNDKGWVAMCGEFIDYEFAELRSAGNQMKENFNRVE